MKMIIEERDCQLIELNGKGVKTVLDFICCCGFRQKSTWYHFYRDKWCRHYNCPYFHKTKELTTELVHDWIEYEQYKVPDGFIYDSKYGNCTKVKYDLICPKNHIFNVSIAIWQKGSRCKICKGDGRTLSYDQIKQVYERHGCSLLYDEANFRGNVTKYCVPYLCPAGHLIEHLTKNDFNNRINSNIGSCPICRNKQRNRKEEHQKTANTMLARYGVKNPLQVPAILDKQRKNGLSLKPYKLPSGKIIQIQGSEALCMDILLQTYDEKDILTEIEDMPPIYYINPNTNKKSRYYPDMFIPKHNIVVESKSTYWLTKEVMRNFSKFKATIETLDPETKEKYQLHLYVFNHKGLLYKNIYYPDDYFKAP